MEKQIRINLSLEDLENGLELVIAVSSSETKLLNGICARDGCVDAVIGRTNKKYCSTFCQKKAWESKRDGKNDT